MKQVFTKPPPRWSKEPEITKYIKIVYKEIERMGQEILNLKDDIKHLQEDVRTLEGEQ